jgi:hypothetical protein
LAHRSLAGAAAQRQRAQPKDANTVSGALRSVDADKPSVTIGVFTRNEGQSEKTYPVAKDAKILRDGAEVKLSDLKQRSRVTLKLSEDQKTVVGVSVSRPSLTAQVKSVDADKNTITITVDNVRKGRFDRVLHVVKDAKVTIDAKVVKLADLKAGATLQFVLSADDGNTVIQVQTPRRRRPGSETPLEPRKQRKPRER